MGTTLQESATPERDDHITPRWFLDRLAAELGRFRLDPCTNPSAEAHHNGVFECSLSLERGSDGLAGRWGGNVFVNPPYGDQIPVWVEKAISEARLGAADMIAMLLPARPDNQWWARCLECAHEIIHVTGRVRFILPGTLAPEGSPKFGSAVVVFRRGSRRRHGMALSAMDVHAEQNAAIKGWKTAGRAWS